MNQPRTIQCARYQGMGLHVVDGNDAWRLMVACTDGDRATAEALLAGDPHLANAQFWYEIPLHFAVREGHLELVRLLLGAGADPATSSFQYYSWPRLLEMAAHRGWREIHKLLGEEMRQRFGYDPDFELLAAAFRAYDPQAIDALLKDFPQLATASDAHGHGAVHWASITHQLEHLDFLLNAGAGLDRGSASGVLPIQQVILGCYHYRSRNVPEVRRLPDRERLDALLSRGARVPLGVAGWMGDEGRFETLLQADPDAARRLDPGGTSPLTYAVMGGNEAAVRKLLELGADPNASETIAPRGRALWEAAASNHLPIARLLLEHGADPNPRVDSSGTAVGIVKSRHADACGPMVALLREHGAVDADWELTREEWKALARAGEWERIDRAFDAELLAEADAELIDLILAHDPDFAERLDGRSFRTPSVRFTATEPVLERLLAAGFPIDRGDWLGRTVLHYAALFGDVAMIGWLLDHGADLEAVELERGTTPLGMAVAGRQLGAAELLLKRGARPDRPSDRPWAQPATLAAESRDAKLKRLFA